MSRKNSGFAADLAAGIDLTEDTAAPRRSSIASNVLTGRSNRLADLASGAIVSRTHELVDPAKCRMWAGHNRDYALLNEERCADLIESIKAQGRQEIPAIVRRLSGDDGFGHLRSAPTLVDQLAALAQLSRLQVSRRRTRDGR